MATADPALTRAEQEMHAALAPLWDATPADIASLRRWCEPISGVRAADYDVVSQDLKFRLGRDLHMMQKQTPDWLFVQEPTALGGFGALKSGERFNADTLQALQGDGGASRRRRAGAAPPHAGPPAGLGDRRRVGRFCLSVQDRLPQRHLCDQRRARAVPGVGRVPDDRLPGCARAVPLRRGAARGAVAGLGDRGLRVRARARRAVARPAAPRPGARHHGAPRHDQ